MTIKQQRRPHAGRKTTREPSEREAAFRRDVVAFVERCRPDLAPKEKARLVRKVAAHLRAFMRKARVGKARHG